MAKKGGKSKSSSEGSQNHKIVHHHETERLLVENFASLQKVLTNLSFKFDELTRQISELLKLFEDSAKIIVKNEMEKKREDKGDKQLLDTMISILDQNKIIAKGLTLMYESMNGEEPMKKTFYPPKNVSLAPEKKKIIKEDEGFSQSKDTNSRLPRGFGR